jgi:hypothetical protein
MVIARIEVEDVQRAPVGSRDDTVPVKQEDWIRQSGYKLRKRVAPGTGNAQRARRFAFAFPSPRPDHGDSITGHHRG